MGWVTYAILSALFLSIMALVQKKVLNKEHALQTLVTMTFFVSIVMTFFVKQVNFSLGSVEYLLIYIKSILLSWSWILLFKSYRHMEISTAEPMRNLSPLFLVIMAVVFLGEQITLLNGIGILIIMIGAYIIQVDHSFGHVIQNLKILKNKHISKLMLSLILVSISAILDKVLTQTYKVDTITIMFFVYWMIFINLFLIFSYKYNGYHGMFHLIKRRHGWVLLIVAARLLSDFSYFHALSFDGVLISLLVPIRRMSTLFTTIIGGEVFHDHGLKTRIIGCGITLIGSLLIIF